MLKTEKPYLMPFGKHKGQALDNVPKGYLHWLKANVPLFSPLVDAVDAVLAGKPVPDHLETLDAKLDRIATGGIKWTPSEGEPA